MSEQELHLKYRPKSLKEVYGQEKAVNKINDFLTRDAVPHALLLEGPPGTGKTTLARILKRKLGCSDHDFHEVNCATIENAIDTIRTIQNRAPLAPMDGSKCRMWLLDEVQALSRSSFAQQGMLKLLEEPPRHCYFVLATTDSSKIIKAVMSRCTKVVLNPITEEDMHRILTWVATQEKAKVSEEVIKRIIEVADGSAREAVKRLNEIIGIEDEDEQLAVILADKVKQNVFELVQALLWQKRDWNKVRTIISNMDEGENWEGIRHLILKNASNTVLKAKTMDGAKKAFNILDAFKDNWYDCGKNGLVWACYEVLRQE